MAEEPGLRGGADGGSGAVLRSVPGMTGGFTRSVWLGSEGGEVGAAGGLRELPGANGTFGADGMAGAMRAVVSAMAGGNGLAGAGGVATVGALLGVPPGFNATGGPGGAGGEDAGLADDGLVNWGGGIFEVSGGDDLGGIGDLMIALPGFNVGAGAIIVEPAEGGFRPDASGMGGFKLVSAPIILLFSRSELVVMVLPVSTSIDPGFGLRS